MGASQLLQWNRPLAPHGADISDYCTCQCALECHFHIHTGMGDRRIRIGDDGGTGDRPCGSVLYIHAPGVQAALPNSSDLAATCAAHMGTAEAWISHGPST